MSHSSVCQGLQSSVIEPRVLKLKLAPPGSDHSRPFEWPRSNTSTHTPPSTNDEHGNKNSEPGGCNWSFLQSLSNISHCKGPQTENVYVHPSVKRSSSMLSAKSLELCTESLGCETGSNASDNTDDDISLFSLESNPSLRSNNTPLVNRNSESKSKRLNRSNTFPPPLTSMGGIKVRSHREDGRLILEAVASSSHQPYFQVERGNGRLRLRLFESVASCYGDEVADDEALNQEACVEDDAVVEEQLEEYVGNAEDEMGVTNFVRPSRCKESGNRVIFGDGYFEHPPLSLCL
ncbi:FANTASTIC FOUR 2 [Spatholobus suberectus]|nr:FANTASTIC FOUR 2 [Spatholobus suberectus]